MDRLLDGAEAKFDVDDSTTALVKTGDGRSITLDVAWATNRPPNETVEVSGTEAGATLTGSELTLLDTDTRVSDHFTDTCIKVRNDTWMAVERAFLDSVSEGTPPGKNTIKEGLAVQRLLDAVYRSDATDQQVSVELA